MIELAVPVIGESITEVQVATWLKQEGDYVEVDEIVAELESDKATVELPAPAAGVITRILVSAGAVAQVGEVIARLDTAARAAEQTDPGATEAAAVASGNRSTSERITPSARRVMAEEGVDATAVTGSGKGGLILKEDVKTTAATTPVPGQAPPVTPAVDATGPLEEEVIPLSPIRRTIARRLIESQQTTAQLTTFNEVDMSAVIELRKRYQEPFQQKYDIKLGFMSFFVKAAVEALKEYPAVNAEIRDDSVVYKNYYNVGIAIGSGKGLVVPVVNGAERLSFARIETMIADFGERGSRNRISLDELTGGTFTISNGGVYGSLLGTPILNPPQSGILGLHAIKDRPVVVDGEIVIRPMMNLALTYDHRIVDGRVSVGFLVKLQGLIEDPARLILEV